MMPSLSRLTPVLLAGVMSLCAVARSADVSTHRYPGDLTVDVDLSDPAQRIFRVHESIPVSPGALTLYYPKWIPGEHAPSGTIDSIAGLVVTSDAGQRIEWRRDLEDMFTLHLTVPAGVKSLVLDFELLSPGPGGEFGQSASATDRIEDLEWNQVLFYPSGYAAHNITFKPSIRIPKGWGHATALEEDKTSGGAIAFTPVSLEQLVDSPLICGLYFSRLDLAPGASVPVHLDLVADDRSDLKVDDAQLQAHRNLITQAQALFGAHHYQHYDFLFTLSENTGHFGLEHSQSSDDRYYAKFFIDPDTYLAGAGLLPHEYVHSWNGKFRRPAGLATPNYNVPMRDDLLWVYEGLTEYLGDVLTARSGIWTPEQYREELAVTAAQMDHRPGRAWRNLQDTADAAQRLYYTGTDWNSELRSVDYYPEGELLWLDVDTTIRELSGGKKSLDDFTRAFYGVDDGSFVVKPYDFADVVKALNAVQPNDWASFLRSRLDTHEPGAPLGGIKRGGWTVTYNDQRSAMLKAHEKTRKFLDLRYSLGLFLGTGPDDTGRVIDVQWGSAAFTAGLAPGMVVVAINGRKFDPDLVDEALRNAQSGQAPIEILARNYDSYSTFKIDYRDGPKYPHLTRVTDQPDRLGDIITAKAAN
ncbi:MAG: M61 family peptidase [Steroidobacteraceae bacterium]|jgi:predicted metalloprotease with PDZ domain